MLTLSVIICTRNRYQDTLRCLDSLARQTQPADEILIVDSSDDDYLGPIVSALFPHTFPDCRVLHSAKGLPRQRNIGIRNSRGDIVLFLDDDVILEPDCLAHLMTVFTTDTAQHYGGGMGLITGNQAATGFTRFLQRLFFLGENGGDGRFKPSGFPSLPHGQKTFMEIETLSGCDMAFRRSVVEKFVFDENLTDYAYMEDDDYAYRVSRHQALFYTPDARLEHRVSTQSRMSNRRSQRMLVRNHRYLFRKNFPHHPANIAAHLVSLWGLIVTRILQGDIYGMVGACEGLFAPLPEIK